MANVSYNIAEVFASQFPATAQKGLGYLLTSPALARSLGRYPLLRGVEPAEVAELNHLGLPIFDKVVFERGTYNFIEGGQLVPYEVPEIVLPLISTIEVRREKIIEETHPNGAVGTVKEMWAFTDWQVSIRGLILAEDPFEFPEQHIRNLRRLEEVAGAIEVSCELFFLLKIRRLVIRSVSLASVQGNPNALPFQIEAVSDNELQIVL